MKDQKITFIFILAIITVILSTFIIHEFAHWLTSEYLGYKTIMRLNGTYPVKSESPTDLHSILISSAGPIITMLQGLIAYHFFKLHNWNKYIYLFLFIAFFMRFLASLMNLRMLNDEGRISVYLKLGIFTLPLVVNAILFYMVYNVSKKYKLNWKFHLLTSLIVAIAITGLIFIDQYFKIRIL